MTLPNASLLSLPAKSVEELRALASTYLNRPLDALAKLNQNELIQLLSNEVAKNPALKKKLNKEDITIKPSFYLMVVTRDDDTIPDKSALKLALSKAILGFNAEANKDTGVPGLKDFVLESSDVTADGVVEAHFVWQRSIWYWSPQDFALAHLYELRFGFLILDLKAKKVLIACQTEAERDAIASIAISAVPATLTPLVLTKKLLDQIGTFAHVKKAGYRIHNPDPNTPANISYADEKLGAIPTALDLENNPQSQRQHSFYRIPLVGLAEQGVGVSSNSGKLWMPRPIPLKAVREFGIELLGKIGKTLTSMSKRGEIAAVLQSLGISQLPSVSAITPLAVRSDVCALITDLVNMIINKETERPYALPLSLPKHAVPAYFNPPRLLLVDPDTGESAFWVSRDGQSQMVSLAEDAGKYTITGNPSGQLLVLKDVEHPLTGNSVTVTKPLECLEMTPSPKLHEAILEAVRHAATHDKRLSTVTSVPFHISGNSLRLPLKAVHGGNGTPDFELSFADVSEFQQANKLPLPSDLAPMRKKLKERGEKCQYMSDAACGSCLTSKQYLCLRSLVVRNLKKPLLLAHSGIERSDMQAHATLDGSTYKLLGFAKIASGKGSLTARNPAGAVLLAQVLGQINKNDFDVVTIISPSPLTEDIRERLTLLCAVFGKKLLILDAEGLGKLLLHFEDQASFENIDPDAVYAASKSKKKKK